MDNTAYSNDAFLRKREIRQRRLRKRRIINTLISLIIFLILLTVVFCFTIFFPIEEISVTGSKIYDASQVIDASTVKIGDNMLSFSQKKLEKEIRNELPYIASVDAKRSLNGKLSLKCTDAKESMCIKTKDGFYVLGKDNFVLNKYKKAPKKLILLEGIKAQLNVGEFVSFEEESKKEILEQILSLSDKYEINKINLTDEYAIYVKAYGRFEVYLGTSNNIAEKLAHLASMEKNIEKNATGKVNLSYWSSKKPEGTFIKDKK